MGHKTPGTGTADTKGSSLGYDIDKPEEDYLNHQCFQSINSQQ